MERTNIQIVEAPVTFQANRDHIVAVFNLNGNTIGVRFYSVESLLRFTTELIEQAAKVWPDNEYIREYLSD